jgi:hypothetical protein
MDRAIKRGARIDEWDADDGRTALTAALSRPIYSREDAAAIWWLLDHGADPNVRDESFFSLPLVGFVETSASVFADKLSSTPRPCDAAFRNAFRRTTMPGSILMPSMSCSTDRASSLSRPVGSAALSTASARRPSFDAASLADEITGRLTQLGDQVRRFAAGA